jgi:Holliday junction resolvase RusA-like endonuclease
MHRQWKTTRPDADNLAKAVFDALNGILWADDSQIVNSTVSKFIASGDEQPHVKVVVIVL